MSEQRHYWGGDRIEYMPDNGVFVFGSNPEGRHGMGAAKAALKFGAKYGVGRGRQGRTYALVTKNLRAGYYEEASGITYYASGVRSVLPEQIMYNIWEMYKQAEREPDLLYFVSYVHQARSLNGYSSRELAGMFIHAGYPIPPNIVFHESWRTLIEPQEK